MSIQSQVVMVTPQMAQKWLSNGGKNRKIAISRVREYADSMNAGKWVLNGEAIVFDANGKLIERTTSFISNSFIRSTQCLCYITRGIDDPRAFETNRQGQKAHRVSDTCEDGRNKQCALSRLPLQNGL